MTTPFESARKARDPRTTRAELSELRPHTIREFHALCDRPSLPDELVQRMVTTTLRARGVELFAFANHLSRRRELTATQVAELLAYLLLAPATYGSPPGAGGSHWSAVAHLLSHPHASAMSTVAAAQVLRAEAEEGYSDELARSTRSRVLHLAGPVPLDRLAAARSMLDAGITPKRATALLSMYMRMDPAQRAVALHLGVDWPDSAVELITAARAATYAPQ